VFALKARRMAEVYQRVFAELARIYRVTIVAGSILLPEPRLQDGVLVAGRGPLANVSVVYRYDGAAVALSRKVFPTAMELPFVAPGRMEELPVLNTGAGRLGVLVCTDSWYPDVYHHLRARRVEIVAVPSCWEPADLWDDPWRGYSGAPGPEDVAPQDVGQLSQREACAKYGMAGRIASCGASAGVNVYLRGGLWDLEFGGEAIVYREGEVRRLDGAALVNVWL
jgi:hypothetical protein